MLLFLTSSKKYKKLKNGIANNFLFIIVGMLFGSFFAEASDRLNMRNERYCEVLLGTGGLIYPSELHVYNTIGLNNCPEELWVALDVANIKKDTKSKVVKLNGPRYWVIDGLINSTLVDPKVRSFNGLLMRKAGIVKLSDMDKKSLGKPYKPNLVARSTNSFFQAGQPVFQLIDPLGQVFFMQSYSIENQHQSLETLESLGTKLDLPNGWNFRTVILKDNFLLPAENGLATIVQDTFLNSYQKAPVTADIEL